MFRYHIGMMAGYGLCPYTILKLYEDVVYGSSGVPVMFQSLA